jgi:hypothetical protein
VQHVGEHAFTLSGLVWLDERFDAVPLNGIEVQEPEPDAGRQAVGAGDVLAIHPRDHGVGREQRGLARELDADAHGLAAFGQRLVERDVDALQADVADEAAAGARADREKAAVNEGDTNGRALVVHPNCPPFPETGDLPSATMDTRKMPSPPSPPSARTPIPLVND